MKRIGLTGGIATGKSTVLQHWTRPGPDRVAPIEADTLAHAALARDGECYAAVIAAFGTEILQADGAIDRRRLGDIVFADAAQRARLNALVHPVVRRAWQAELENLARAGRVRLAVAAIPLLFEVGVAAQFDVVVAVGCAETTQLARLAAQGLSESQARARLAAQWPLQQKLDRADYVIWNDGGRALLEEQADIIRAAIKEN